MMRSELDTLIARVGGMVHLTDMLTQITRAQHCPLVRALAERPKGADALYHFFTDESEYSASSYYLELEPSNASILAPYDSLNLVYGNVAGVPTGGAYTFPFIKCADNRYALIMMQTYPWRIHHSLTNPPS